MNYAQIRNYDTANGTGIRATIFLSGCTIKCKGCFNPEYQDFNYGNVWTKEVEDKFIEHIQKPQIVGVTILGGEPFDQPKEELLNLVTRINKPIWIYSGYTFEKLITDSMNRKILKQCDTLVDGAFIQSKRNLMLKFRGSENQRIIKINADEL